MELDGDSSRVCAWCDWELAMDGREISTQATWILLACLSICCYDENVLYRCFVFVELLRDPAIVSIRLLLVCKTRVNSYQD